MCGMTRQRMSKASGAIDTSGSGKVKLLEYVGRVSIWSN